MEGDRNRRRRLSCPPMRRGLFLALAVLALATGAGAESLTHGGVARKYVLHVPPGPRPRPLFVMLHPGGSYVAQFRRISGLDAAADAAGAAVVYPQGLSGHWNDGRTSGDGAPIRGGDDVGFLVALVERLVAEGIADPASVHLVGHSNGGMMAMRVACEAPERFQSVAAVSASLPAGLPCPGAARPIAALVIRGGADPYLPLAGGRVKGEERRGTVLSAEATLAAFAKRNGCTEPESKRSASGSGPDATPVVVTTFRRCTGAPTVGVAVEGGGHGWPGFPYGPRMTAMIGPATPSFSAAHAIARFFVAREVPLAKR
jgi:polyhydroxybutyrate depolymerase